ncbi:MAG: nucleotidyltransferase family protein [Calditrichaeota bacterium]|nr:MAG: nucleotidyltransferase family protein [Calditrichota bacterium]MBL1205806.1 nucleotidyltransferase family protein [Calditrichota bacterium]NOG45634.1 NTP transferase domain-containing protein [Calditrichota bacterium]
MKALVFAAGLGTRLKPLTNSIPKAMVAVNGKPMLEWVILRLIEFDIKEIIVNVHHHAGQIIDFLRSKNNFGIKIEISHEKELLDTGGGLKKTAWFFENEKDLLIHNADILSDIDLKAMYVQHTLEKADATLAVRKRKTNRYLLFKSDGQLCGWTAKKENKTLWAGEPENNSVELSFAGIHIISAKLLTKLNTNNIFPIIPEYLRLASHYNIKGFDTTPFKWIDLGRKENLLDINKIFDFKYFKSYKK